MKTLVIILTILIFTSISDILFACSCIGQRTIQEEIKQVDAVLVGTVLNKTTITLIDSTILKMFPNDTSIQNYLMSKITIARYDFLVKDIYKGKITNDTITIYTGLGGDDCGIEFEVEKNYIIYGVNETYFGQGNNDFKFPKAKNSFWTYICLQTTSYSQDKIREIEEFAKKIINYGND